MQIVCLMGTITEQKLRNAVTKLNNNQKGNIISLKSILLKNDGNKFAFFIDQTIHLFQSHVI